MKHLPAKPIFIVKLPKTLNREKINIYLKQVKKEFSDYHVLLVATNKEEYDFEAFYPKDFESKEFEKFKAEFIENWKTSKED